MIKEASRMMMQILRHTVFVAKNFKLFPAVVGLTLCVLFLEYLATSLMVPMSSGQSATDSMVVHAWQRFAEAVDMAPETRTWLWIFFVVMMIRLFLGYVLTVLTTRLGKKVHETLSIKIFGHVIKHEPMGQVYRRSVGHYITMAGDDTFKSGTIISSLLQSSVGFMTATVGLMVLYQTSAQIFIGVVIFLLATLTGILFLMRRLMRQNNRSINFAKEIRTIFIESLNSLRSIRSLHGENFVVSNFAQQMKSYAGMLLELEAIKAGVKTFPAIFLLIVATIMLRPGHYIEMTDAALFAVTIIVIRVFASLGQMVTAGSQLLTDMRAIKDINMLVDLAKTEELTENEKCPIQVNSIELKNITFGYSEREPLFHDLNFTFQIGKTYAIVGPSGSGKSTLTDLLLGLNSPDSGTILINNGETSLQRARHGMVLVEQQPKIFSKSIKDNLLMGMHVSDEELYEALELVNLKDFVKPLPQGLNTRLTYLGENFSGGQRQRLGIARALVRQPEVLILDEATSALDAGTRAEVVGKLRAWMSGGIIIFITHDPEIARLADEVLSISGQHKEAAKFNVKYGAPLASTCQK